jgi:hypothetical protein
MLCWWGVATLKKWRVKFERGANAKIEYSPFPIPHRISKIFFRAKPLARSSRVKMFLSFMIGWAQKIFEIESYRTASLLLSLFYFWSLIHFLSERRLLSVHYKWRIILLNSFGLNLIIWNLKQRMHSLQFSIIKNCELGITAMWQLVWPPNRLLLIPPHCTNININNIVFLYFENIYF